jgi:hypothetical protein
LELRGFLHVLSVFYCSAPCHEAFQTIHASSHFILLFNLPNTLHLHPSFILYLPFYSRLNHIFTCGSSQPQHLFQNHHRGLSSLVPYISSPHSYLPSFIYSCYFPFCSFFSVLSSKPQLTTDTANITKKFVALPRPLLRLLRAPLNHPRRKLLRPKTRNANSPP